MNKQVKNNTNYIDELFFLSYTIPFFIADSLSVIIIGRFYSLKYSIIYEGWQARGIGLVFFLLGLKIFYELYIKLPHKMAQEISYQFRTIFYKSLFIYFLLFTIIIITIVDYYQIDYRIFIFLFLLISTFIAQFNFNRKYKAMLESS